MARDIPQPVSLSLLETPDGSPLVHGKDVGAAVRIDERDRARPLLEQRAVQAARQIRLTSVQEVTKLAKTVKAYVREAIEIERSGLQVQLRKTEDFELPEEFELELAAGARLKKAFAALTPGRQRAYIFHFSQPKLSKTRAARVEKPIPRILKGLGLDD